MNKWKKDSNDEDDIGDDDVFDMDVDESDDNEITVTKLLKWKTGWSCVDQRNRQ